MTHRPARSPEEAALELWAEVAAGRLDGDAVDAVLRAAGHRVKRRRGGAEGRLEEIEVIAYPHASDWAPYHAQVDAARARLDREAWERAWAEGRAMTTEQAVAEALGGRPGTPVATADSRRLAPARELQREGEQDR